MRRVAVARGISLTGSGAAFTVLGYMVYRLTDESAIWLSLTLLLTMGVQGLVQPFASWLGDRFDRRRVLVISDLCAAVGFVGLAFARTPGQLVALAMVTAVLESPVWAVAGASPVRRATCRPRRFRRSMAEADVALTGSETPSTPAITPSTAT